MTIIIQQKSLKSRDKLHIIGTAKLETYAWIFLGENRLVEKKIVVWCVNGSLPNKLWVFAPIMPIKLWLPKPWEASWIPTRGIISLLSYTQSHCMASESSALIRSTSWWLYHMTTKITICEDKNKKNIAGLNWIIQLKFATSIQWTGLINNVDPPNVVSQGKLLFGIRSE